MTHPSRYGHGCSQCASQGWPREGEEEPYLEATFDPADILFRLADEYAVILLNGKGFAGPAWSVRVSLANLDDLDYLKIGHHLRAVPDGYAAQWRAATSRADR